MASTSTIILCTDGSDLAIQAAVNGLEVLRPADSVLVVTVVDGVDMSMAQDVSGHAAAVFTEEELTTKRAALLAEGNEIVERTAAALDGVTVQTQVLEGLAGQVICDLAAQVDATAIVIGSRGRGGVKRALLGSVSDHGGPTPRRAGASATGSPTGTDRVAGRDRIGRPAGRAGVPGVLRRRTRAGARRRAHPPLRRRGGGRARRVQHPARRLHAGGPGARRGHRRLDRTAGRRPDDVHDDGVRRGADGAGQWIAELLADGPAMVAVDEKLTLRGGGVELAMLEVLARD